MKTKRLVQLSLLLSIAIVLNIVESLYLNIFPIPGVKIGLANIITLILMYCFSIKDAGYVILTRILLVSFVLGTFLAPTFFYSLFGGLVAFFVMILLEKSGKFHIITISIMGSLGHSVGQIFVAILLFNTIEIVFYLPWIILLAIPTGVFTGIVSKKVIYYLENQV